MDAEMQPRFQVVSFVVISVIQYEMATNEQNQLTNSVRQRLTWRLPTTRSLVRFYPGHGKGILIRQR